MSADKFQLTPRFWDRVQKTETCWLWKGGLTRGYGYFSHQGKMYRVHRLAYMEARGPISKGLQLDHLCRVRNCVNPEHLEPVTPRVNTLRGISTAAANAKKTHCKRGHEFTPENTRHYVRPGSTTPSRVCIICKINPRKDSRQKEGHTGIKKEKTMSRSGYSDDCQHLNLWRSNVERTIRGQRGQAFLRELVAALEAMPEKRLIAHELRAETGEVCAIGSVGLKRGIDMSSLDPEDPEQVGKAFGISSMLAQEIVYENDERGYRQTPEERWSRMHKWAVSHLNPPTRPANPEGA